MGAEFWNSTGDVRTFKIHAIKMENSKFYLNDLLVGFFF